MCGRFTLTKPYEDIERVLSGIEAPDLPSPHRYNIAPTQPVATVLRDPRLRLTFTQWGLVPSWARDPSIGSRLINARAETAAQKPAFQAAFRRRRCLILADGFYEWHASGGPGGAKQPVYVRMKSGHPFAFAGLWEHWQSAEGSELTTSTILTTTPNRLLQSIHNRMPVILPTEAWKAWLDPDLEGGPELRRWLAPYPEEEMEYFPVSTRVNSPRHDDPACIAPAPAAGPPGQLELF